MAAFTLHDLEKRVQERAKASAEVSYTRKLIDRGVSHCAKKLGEEAVEAALAAVEEFSRVGHVGGGPCARLDALFEVVEGECFGHLHSLSVP